MRTRPTPDHRADPPADDHASDAALAADVTRTLRHAVVQAIAGLAGHGDRVALTLPRAAVPLAPARLAAAHPGGATARRQMQAVYERCLAHYREVLRPDDAARGLDDVGAAAARFVAANLFALHGEHATPDALLALEAQLAGIVRSSPAWADASARDRQLYVEKLALLAVFVGEVAQQARGQGAGAVENVRRAARTYLRELLGLNPDALTLGRDGLTLREPAPGACAG